VTSSRRAGPEDFGADGVNGEVAEVAAIGTGGFVVTDNVEFFVVDMANAFNFLATFVVDDNHIVRSQSAKPAARNQHATVP
jgi:hypothetical protein